MRGEDIQAILRAYSYLSCANHENRGLCFLVEGEQFIIQAEDVPCAVAICEKTYDYFDTKDDAKGKFVRLAFFERRCWKDVISECGISQSTMRNWRREVIQVGKSIAKNEGFSLR